MVPSNSGKATAQHIFLTLIFTPTAGFRFRVSTTYCSRRRRRRPNSKPQRVGSRVTKLVSKPRRGKLMEVACRMLGAFGQDSRFTTCQ